MNLITVLTVLLHVIILVTCYPKGAGESACATLIPGHGFPAQKDSSPYDVGTSAGEYAEGSTINGRSQTSVTLRFTYNTYFSNCVYFL